MSSSDSSSHSLLIAEFCCLVGLGESSNNHHHEFASSFLSGHGWRMETAVNAYLEMKADSEAHATNGDADGGGGGIETEKIRAPIPDKVDQLCTTTHKHTDDAIHLSIRTNLISRPLACLPALFCFLSPDDDTHLSSDRVYHAVQSTIAHRLHRSSRLAGLAPPPAAAAAAASSPIDPFRNFATEKRHTANAGSGPTRRQSPQDLHNAKLSALFKPPDELIFVGPNGDSSLIAAAAQAVKESKWLLVNVQQGDEFSSHQLNRDVWNNPLIHQLVSRHFIFSQPNHNTTIGMRYRQLYHPPSMPTIAILDPITRQKLWDAHHEGGAQLIINKKFIKMMEEILRAFAAKKDLTLNNDDSHTHGSNSSAAQEEENRLMQAAINVRETTYSVHPLREC